MVMINKLKKVSPFVL